MNQQLLLGLVGILVLGLAGQLMARFFRIPAILVLLALGAVVGPITGILNPEKILGPLLLPMVSLCVAVILFEGGLSLRLRELRDIGSVFFKLITIGVPATWIITTLTAHHILGFRWGLAGLLGALLVVTGPTVVVPLLRHLRLSGKTGVLLKWEGIFVDPVGAILAVLIFEALHNSELHEAAGQVFLESAYAFIFGVGVGLLGAGVLIFVLKRYWVPDHLHVSVVLVVIFAVAALSNQVRGESGLLAVTIMGITLANQKAFPVNRLMEFSENLNALILSSLFIILASRLQPEDLTSLNKTDLIFVAVLILVVRPLAILLSTVWSSLNWRERIFLMAMAPRGIIAAAVASVFSLEMMQAGYPLASRMAPITFLVIIGTVTVYGLCAAPLARWLHLADPNPQGTLIVGAHTWARSLARALAAEGYPVLLTDTDWTKVSAARLEGLPIYYGSILAEQAMHEMELAGFRRLLALTSNNEVNSLACLRFTQLFGRQEVYQLAFKRSAEDRHEAVGVEHRGRFLFDRKLDYQSLTLALGKAPLSKTTRLTKDFDHSSFRLFHGDKIIPAFLVKENGDLAVFTADEVLSPDPGQAVISLRRG
ncbi:MAG: cation:proton antiporter [Syntrophobacteraceae bacterium]